MHFLWQNLAHSIPRDDNDEGGGGGDPAPAPAPTPAPAPQTSDPAWASVEDEEVRGLMEKKGYTDYGAVAKAYHNLNKLHNGAPDVMAVPGEDAGDDVWNSVFTRLGRPESPDGYDFGLGEDAEVDADFMANAKTWLHNAGVPADRAKGFAEAYQNYVAERMADAQDSDRRTAEAEIKEIKGKYGEKADAVILRGQNAIKALGLSDDLVDRIESQMGAPAVIELIATLGERIGSEDVRIDGVNSDGLGQSDAEIRSRMAAMRSDGAIVKALTNPQDPSHNRYKAEWDRLNAEIAKRDSERDRRNWV